MRAPEAGFTLIESLVALAVLAVGAVSLLAATEGHARRIGDVADRAAARWAAEARLTERRLGIEPEAGPVESLGRLWALEEDARGTADPDLLAVTVAARPAEGPGPTVRLSGYVEAP